MSMSSHEPTSERVVRSLCPPYYTGPHKGDIGFSELGYVNGKTTALSIAKTPVIDITPLTQTVIDTYKKTANSNVELLVDISWKVTSNTLSSWKGRQKIWTATKVLDGALEISRKEKLLTEKEIETGQKFGPYWINQFARIFLTDDIVDSIVLSVMNIYSKTVVSIKLKSLASTVWNVTVVKEEILFLSGSEKIRIANLALVKVLNTIPEVWPERLIDTAMAEGLAKGEIIITRLAKELLERDRFSKSEAPKIAEDEHYEIDESSYDDCQNSMEHVYEISGRRNSVENSEEKDSPEIKADQVAIPTFRFGRPQNVPSAEEDELELTPLDYHNPKIKNSKQQSLDDRSLPVEEESYDVEEALQKLNLERDVTNSQFQCPGCVIL